MHYQRFSYGSAVNVCERRLKILFFWVFLVAHPLASANEPSDCYPYCSQTEITKAKQFVTTEIYKLSSQIRRSESTINRLENDIAVVEFNIRRRSVQRQRAPQTSIASICRAHLPIRNQSW